MVVISDWLDEGNAKAWFEHWKLDPETSRQETIKLVSDRVGSASILDYGGARDNYNFDTILTLDPQPEYIIRFPQRMGVPKCFEEDQVRNGVMSVLREKTQFLSQKCTTGL